MKLGVERFLPKLRESADRIRKAFIEQRRLSASARSPAYV
jgi:hypothetical protein